MAFDLMLRPEAATEAAEYFRRLYPDLASAVNGRLEKAQEIASGTGKISVGDLPNTYHVRSQSNPRGFYIVDTAPARWTCTCPDHPRAPSGLCKHILAVGLHLRYPDWCRAAYNERSYQINRYAWGCDRVRGQLDTARWHLELANLATDDERYQARAEEIANLEKALATLQARYDACRNAPIIVFATR